MFRRVGAWIQFEVTDGWMEGLTYIGGPFIHFHDVVGNVGETNIAMEVDSFFNEGKYHVGLIFVYLS